jgi:hypothetical protein
VEKPDIPGLIETPADEELVCVAHASGFQIYVCRPDADGKPGWVLKAPDAQLYDQNNEPIGTHFAGPTWHHQDGSQITARVAARVNAPVPGAIPWLLLAVTGHSGSGVLSRISSIQRVNTVGGEPPSASKCDGLGGEVEFRSRYSADYYFYARRA